MKNEEMVFYFTEACWRYHHTVSSLGRVCVVLVLLHMDGIAENHLRFTIRREFRTSNDLRIDCSPYFKS